MAKNYWKYLILFLMNISLHAQNPAYFQTTIDDGLPSNEVYSIVEDTKGFIWIGCDAGLYKYDGVRFHVYKSKPQKTKAITGLCISASGKLYCYNFSGQLFYVEKDSLQNITSWQDKVSNIICDKDNNLWVCSEKGINCYNEINQKWINYSDFDSDKIQTAAFM
jgi:ligand-binding sensor domain-containing protein